MYIVQATPTDRAEGAEKWLVCVDKEAYAVINAARLVCREDQDKLISQVTIAKTIPGHIYEPQSFVGEQHLVFRLSRNGAGWEEKFLDTGFRAILDQPLVAN